MTIILAIAGKGGVGKSTVAALLVRALHERGKGVIMAVDADPNSNLGQKLGVTVERTIGELREDLLKRADEIPPGQSKQEFVEYQMQLAKVEGDYFDLIAMGRPEGAGCYCYINNILRTFLDLAMQKYDYVVIDNEAGMEHLSRRTTKKMDVLAIVTDYTKVGLETAGRLFSLAREMKISIGKTALIINLMPESTSSMVERMIDELDTDVVARIPRSEEIAKRAVEGRPLLDLPASDPAYTGVQRILRLTGQ